MKSALVIHRYFSDAVLQVFIVLGLLAAVVRILVTISGSWPSPGPNGLRNNTGRLTSVISAGCANTPSGRDRGNTCSGRRRTVNKVPSPEKREKRSPNLPGLRNLLFEQCGACRWFETFLLPFCLHCGAEKKSMRKRKRAKNDPMAAEDGCRERGPLLQGHNLFQEGAPSEVGGGRARSVEGDGGEVCGSFRCRTGQCPHSRRLSR